MLAAKVLKYLAFTLILLFGVFGLLFAAGYAVEDPGGWAAAGLISAQLVPIIILAVLALWKPAWAAPVFVVITVLVVLFNILDSAFGLLDRNVLGPIGSISVLALALSLGFLGLRRTTLAGILLVVLAVAQFVATVVGFFSRMAGMDEAPPIGAMLGGSSGVVVVPILIVGILFWVAGALATKSKPREKVAA